MSKKNRKHKGRRKNSKFPNLDKKLNRMNLRQYLDFDYLEKLNEDEKKFLDTFVKNVYTADFRGDNLINKDKERKKIYINNNSRNNDQYNRSLILGSLKDISKVIETGSDPEDALIELLDMSLRLKKSD